jgi:hypothetical protein
MKKGVPPNARDGHRMAETAEAATGRELGQGLHDEVQHRVHVRRESPASRGDRPARKTAEVPADRRAAGDGRQPAGGQSPSPAPAADGQVPGTGRVDVKPQLPTAPLINKFQKGKRRLPSGVNVPTAARPVKKPAEKQALGERDAMDKFYDEHESDQLQNTYGQYGSDDGSGWIWAALVLAGVFCAGLLVGWWLL